MFLTLYKSPILFIAGTILFWSCASTEMMHSGKTRSFKATNPDKIVVFAVTKQLEATSMFEDLAISSLKSVHPGLEKASKVLGDLADLKEKSNEEIADQLRELGYGGAIVVSLVSIRMQQEATTDPSQFPSRNVYGFMTDYKYQQMIQEYDKREVKDRFVENQVVKMDLKVYDLTGQPATVIWSGRGVTENPKSTRQLGRSFLSKAGSKLKKDRIFDPAE